MREVEGPILGPKLSQDNAIETPVEKTAKPRLSAPYSEVYKGEFLEKYPEEKAAAEAIFEEMDEQIISSYESYKSDVFPGVAFSHIKLKVTPEVIRKIAATNPDSKPLPEGDLKPQTSKNQKWFLFTAFALYPGGDALTVGDLGIDRFMRLIPTVARAVQNGEIPPGAEINLMGAPTGHGGAVTKEWIDEIKKDGFNAYGRLYAEYVKKHVPNPNSPELDNTRIILQGVSKGTNVADNTYKNLPPEIQKHTQELIDNPAGDHNPRLKLFSGLKVLGGLIGETVTRMMGDSTMKQLMTKDKAFYAELLPLKGISEDTPEQKKLKKRAVKHEGFRLLSGTPLDTEHNRLFIRRAIFDPLTFNPFKLIQVQREIGRQIETVSQKLAATPDYDLRRRRLDALTEQAIKTGMSKEEQIKRAQIILDQPNEVQAELKQAGEEFPDEKAKQAISANKKGRGLEVAIKAKGHFFTLYQDWRRWKQNIEFAKGKPSTPPKKAA